MKMADFRNLDFNNVGSWPTAFKAIAIGLLCTAVLGAGYWFESQNQLPELDEARSKEMELKQTYSTKAAKAANLEAYKEQLAEMQESFGAMLRQLPSKTEVADLLVDISQTGLASGLEFELFRPENEVPRDFYAELPITIKVTGRYHDFGAFVTGVAALPRIVTLHDIAIKPAGKGSGRLAMDVTAKTYRYLDEESQQESAKESKKSKKGGKK
jgi:type IV pilus assembly protein PilO